MIVDLKVYKKIKGEIIAITSITVLGSGLILMGGKKENKIPEPIIGDAIAAYVDDSGNINEVNPVEDDIKIEPTVGTAVAAYIDEDGNVIEDDPVNLKSHYAEQFENKKIK